MPKSIQFIKSTLFVLLIPTLFLSACSGNHANNEDAPGYHNPLVAPLTMALSQHPGDPTLLFRRSQALLQVNQPKLAKRDLETALQKDSNNLQYLFALSRVELRLDQNDSAVKCLQKVLTKAPRILPVKLALAEAYMKTKQYQKAEKTAGEILRVDSTYPGGLYTLARIHLAEKDTTVAIQILQRALQLRSDDYSSSYLLANCLSEQNDNKAIEQFRLTFDMDTTKVAPLVALGKFYEHRDDFKKAKKTYRECLLKDPDCTAALINTGKLLVVQDSITKALRQFTVATQTKPNSAEAYYQRGLCFEKLNQRDSAWTAFSQALVFAPKRKDIRSALTRVRPQKLNR